MRKRREKASIVIIVILVTLWEAILPTVLYLLDMPLWIVTASAAIVLLVGIGLCYFALERFREIEEGLEDDVDNY